MTCCGSKNNFCKKSGAHLIRAKGQIHPGSSEIGRSVRKIQKITPEGMREETRADMCIPGGLLFMWGLVPSFEFVVLVAASQQTRFCHSKNGKQTFCGTK
jgi:hypothetical protein